MANTYTETPENFCEIEAYVETKPADIKNAFYKAERVVFYDACSFQRHSHLSEKTMRILTNYFRTHGSIVFITGCILMELASDRHVLAEEYLHFIKEMSGAGVKVAVFQEEYTYDILSECFATNETINRYLGWAVRNARSPVSQMEEALKADRRIAEELLTGKNAEQSDVYRRFFTAAREKKEHGDNLGEDLIAVCIHILSHLPGVPDGKLYVITDDKGAAGKINSVIRRTNPQNRGAGILLLSTPKLVQHIYQEQVQLPEKEMVRSMPHCSMNTQEQERLSEEEMVHFLSQGVSGNIVVMGLMAYDLEVNVKISMTCRELAKKIIEPNGINIVF